MDVLKRWKESSQFWPVGGFMEAVLCGNWMQALGTADTENFDALPHIWTWCYNNLPPTSWGSAENFDRWFTYQVELHRKVEEEIGNVSRR